MEEITDKNFLVSCLNTLPNDIYNAEIKVLEAQKGVTQAKEFLAAKEADLYAEGLIDGKNAEIRNAQLRQLTAEERSGVALAENRLAQCRINLSCLQNQFSACKAIAGMFKGAE